jgi:polyhydroxybutyrate depolymerase
VIPAAVQAACADPGRVGVTGVSNGGGMAARMACDAADLVAAVAPVAGGYKSLPDCHPSRPVPLLEIHGTSDRVVPYRGSGAQRSGDVSAFLTQWRRLNGCSPRAERRFLHRRKPARRVTELRWTDCAQGSAVIHDRVVEAEHGWPGESDYVGSDEFSSTLRTWQFLSAF